MPQDSLCKECALQKMFVGFLTRAQFLVEHHQLAEATFKVVK